MTRLRALWTSSTVEYLRMQWCRCWHLRSENDADWYNNHYQCRRCKRKYEYPYTPRRSYSMQSRVDPEVVYNCGPEIGAWEP